MKLWLLEPLDDRRLRDDPWCSMNDIKFGFVVRAESELCAREIAAKYADDEGAHAWMRSDYSTCEEVTQDGEACVILESD